jgi:hypothetical protein
MKLGRRKGIMRFCLLIFFFLNSSLAAENDPANATGRESSGFSERFTGHESCSVGRICPNTPLSVDWGDQLTNIDLLKEMTKKLPRNPEPIVVIDKAFDVDMKTAMGEKFELQQKPGATIDEVDHGTGTAAIAHLTSPKAGIEFVAGDVTAAQDVHLLMEKVRKTCKDGEIITSSVAVSPKTSFYDQDSKTLEAVGKKGCIPVFAAGNNGGDGDDVYVTMAALNRSGERPAWAAIGRTAAAGDRVMTLGKNGEGISCFADTYYATGSSYAVQQGAGVLDMLKQILRQSRTYREKSSELRGKILLYIFNVSRHADGRMDAYRAGVIAKAFVAAKKWPTTPDEEARTTLNAVLDDHAAKHGAPFTNCSTKSCSTKKSCYDEKRRWLATATAEATEVKKAALDLFLTAHNAGDFELAQNWGMQLEPPDMENSGAEWGEFRKRVKKLSDRTLVDEYLKSISGLLPIPLDVRSKRTDTP